MERSCYGLGPSWTISYQGSFCEEGPAISPISQMGKPRLREQHQVALLPKFLFLLPPRLWSCGPSRAGRQWVFWGPGGDEDHCSSPWAASSRASLIVVPRPPEHLSDLHVRRPLPRPRRDPTEKLTKGRGRQPADYLGSLPSPPQTEPYRGLIEKIRVSQAAGTVTASQPLSCPIPNTRASAASLSPM